MDGVASNTSNADAFITAIPKDEIEASSFLKEHPDYDGREVIIAIFDTGIDPGAKGLQITTDGRPKIVDVLDCTGSGDVDTSQIVEVAGDGHIIGVNGKRMQINSDWKNPTGIFASRVRFSEERVDVVADTWHVGVRPLYELSCGSLTQIIKTKRKEKFVEMQRVSVTHATKELADFLADHSNDLTEEEQKQKSELEGRVQLLQTMMGSYDDPGPMIDCVVWRDGSHWRAALDLTDLYDEDDGRGKLENFKPLTNYFIEHGYRTLSNESACNFVLNIYNDGNRLSIVIDSGMHGTHVAGIAAAYHPENPEYNGIAPGAQIVACKIGDTRLGSLETGVGVVRAAIAAISRKVDIINFSYGEGNALPNSGRALTLINDLVHQHGIIFAVSAGNEGPALSTVYAPGCSSAPVTFGAYLSPQMATELHSARGELEHGLQYTFSSRGPLVDGSRGVDLSAPGGAISNVPQYYGRSRTLANGTSMASPSGAGGIALVISALKQSGGQITPNRVRRALLNTANLPSNTDHAAPDELTFGCGVLQVARTWEYLRKSVEVDNLDVRFEIDTKRNDDNSVRRIRATQSGYPEGYNVSGIYIREPQDAGKAHVYDCWITPILRKDADVVNEKLDVEAKLKLESTADWVTCPDVLLLFHGTRDFEVHVDGRHLPEGVSYAEIRGYDSAAEWRGPLFRLPVTVITPKILPHDTCDVSLGAFEFTPGKEIRRFIAVPEGATWAEIVFVVEETDGNQAFYHDAIAFVPGIRIDTYRASSNFYLVKGVQKIHTLEVIGGRTLEVAVAQYWSSLGTSRMRIDVEFHGVNILQGKNLTLDGSAGVLPIQVVAPLRREQIKPAFSLKSVHIPLRPVESSLVPLEGERDTLPEERVIHRLTLTYKLKLQEGGRITPRLPQFNRQLYDSQVEGIAVQVFDSNKKLLLFSDVYPTSVTVKKGDFTLMASIRHDNVDMLKQFEHMTLIVEKSLEKILSIPVYTNHIESAKGGTRVAAIDLYQGQMKTIIVGPFNESLPKDCAPGYVMNGAVTLGQCRLKSTTAPATMTISYIVPPNKITSGGNSTLPDDLPVLAKLSNAARDAKITALNAMSIKTESNLKDFEAAAPGLKDDFPGHLPLLTAIIKKYDTMAPSVNSDKTEDILSLCEEVVTCIDKVELAVYCARKTPDTSKEGKKRAKEANEEKEALIFALEKQLSILLKQKMTDSVDAKMIKPVVEELQKWTVANDPLVAIANAKLEASQGRYAEAITLLDAAAGSDKPQSTKEVYELKVEYEKKLGWHHWARYERGRIDINFPKKFAPL